MTWPTYPNPNPPHPALVRHNAHMAGEQRPGPAGVYGAALDVWRDGAHLWRSWSDGEHLDDWAARHFAHLDVVPTDHDNGPWRAQGVALSAADMVPTLDAVRWIGGAREVCDLIGAALAIGQLPARPEGLDDLPNPQTVHTALSRAAGGWTVLTTAAAGVTVRALVTRCEGPPVAEAPDAPTGPPSRWEARLERRTVRADATLRDLPEGVAVFEEADARPHILARRAKAALGVSGWGAQRQPESLIWHLARAPYRMEIVRIDGTSTPAVRSQEETAPWPRKD